MTPCSALGSRKGHQTADGNKTACGLTVDLLGTRSARRDRCLRCYPPADPPRAPVARLKPLAQVTARPRRATTKTTKSQRPAAPKPKPSTPAPTVDDLGTGQGLVSYPCLINPQLPPVWHLCDRLDAAYADAVRAKPLDPTDVPRRRRW